MYKPKSKLPESAFRSQESQPKEEQAPSKPVRYHFKIVPSLWALNTAL